MGRIILGKGGIKRELSFNKGRLVQYKSSPQRPIWSGEALNQRVELTNGLSLTAVPLLEPVVEHHGRLPGRAVQVSHQAKL
jgi:hypothetical protein